MKRCVTERNVCFSQTLVELQRLKCHRTRLLRSLERAEVTHVHETEVGVGDAGVRRRVIRIFVDRRPKRSDARPEIAFGAPIPKIPALKICLVRFGNDALARLTREQADLNLCGDLARDIALQRKNVFELSFVAVGPHVCLVADLNQLCADAHAIRCAPNAPFEHVRNAQLAANLLDRFLRRFVRHRRRSRDDAEPLRIQPPQLRDHLFGQAVAERIVLLRAAQIFEGQHDEK